MPAFLLAIFTPVAKWWSSTSWTTKLTIAAIVAVAAVIFVQHRIIISNQAKIATLETTVEALQLDAKLQAIQTKIDNLKNDIKTNADAIAANQVVIGQIRVKIYKQYKPDPNMKAATIVEGFKALQNAPQ